MADQEPTGLCSCGCGQRTTIATRTSRREGCVKGQPRRFIRWHGNGRPRLHDWYPTYRGTYEHRLRAERALGKSLPPGAIVHHADNSRNPHAQLVICQDHAYHMLLHARMRVVRAGGNPNTEKICHCCKQLKPKTAFGPRPGGPDDLNGRCRPCDVVLARIRYRRRVGPPVPRNRFGGANAHAKLNDVAVHVIEWLLAHGVSMARIGRAYGISAPTVRLVRDGKHWAQQVPECRVTVTQNS